MMNKRLADFRIILASKSPRRHYLLKELGLRFDVLESDIGEEYPDGMAPDQIARYLAEKKAENIDLQRLPGNAIIIAADTIVSLAGEILGKPEDYQEAFAMLKKLSGRQHEVVTGVCIRSRDREKLFSVTSTVFFKVLSDDEIDYYINNFRPYDKAGGYGIQEWIGYVGIDRIEGSFFNVMGLPVKEVYEELLKNYSYLC